VRQQATWEEAGSERCSQAPVTAASGARRASVSSGHRRVGGSDRI
jgi:hypothetical protein